MANRERRVGETDRKRDMFECKTEIQKDIAWTGVVRILQVLISLISFWYRWIRFPLHISQVFQMLGSTVVLQMHRQTQFRCKRKLPTAMYGRQTDKNRPEHAHEFTLRKINTESNFVIVRFPLWILLCSVYFCGNKEFSF